MQTTTKLTRPIAPAHPDPEVVQRLVTRRLARQLRVAEPVAALVAALAGIGPENRRASR